LVKASSVGEATFELHTAVGRAGRVNIITRHAAVPGVAGISSAPVSCGLHNQVVPWSDAVQYEIGGRSVLKDGVLSGLKVESRSAVFAAWHRLGAQANRAQGHCQQSKNVDDSGFHIGISPRNFHLRQTGQ
jgi:hypothetical protein